MLVLIQFVRGLFLEVAIPIILPHVCIACNAEQVPRVQAGTIHCRHFIFKEH
jgi:ribosomal protein L37AE/L43A